MGPTADLIMVNESRPTSDEDLELSRQAVTDADLLAIRVTDDDLAGMGLSVEEVLATTGADWVRLRLGPRVLIDLRDDLMLRLGVSKQDLTWLSHAIERAKYGHPRSQTGTD